MIVEDKLSEIVLRIVESADEPLETKEVVNQVSGEDASRDKILYRLKNLRGDRKIEGKYVGPGKGVWIWWKREAFKKTSGK